MNPIFIKQPSPVSSSERSWVLWLAFIGMLITTIPYLVGFSTQGTGWHFSGFVFGVNDGNSYIAKMRAGAEGEWLFRTPYSIIEQEGILVYLPFILLGKLTNPPAQHEQLVAVYHLYRFVGGMLAILATYDFMAYFIERISLRRFGTIIACFGGGLGWLLVIVGQNVWLGSLPLDFFSPETFGFLSLFGLPHLAVARALLLWGMLAYLQPNAHYPIATIKLDSAVQAGLILLMLGFFQPLTIAVAWAVIGVHLAGLTLSLAGRRSRDTPANYPTLRLFFRRAIIIGLISSPFVAYSFLSLLIDPFLRIWTEQNAILSPPPSHYFVAYGLVLPFTLVGAIKLINSKSVAAYLPVGWIVLLPIMAYAPINLQRRLPEGVWVALVMLAMSALDRADKPPRTLAYIPFALTLPTTLLLIFGGINAAAQPYTPIFRTSAEVEAFLFLNRVAKPGEVVLSAFETGNVLPAWTPVRVLIGHGPESVGLAELRPRVEAFFHQETSDDSRKSLLDEFRVNYVFLGPNERALGKWVPTQASYLEEIYMVGEYAIYSVNP